MLPYDSKHKVQAETGTLVLRFCGEEWLKDTVLDLQRDARTGIENFNKNVFRLNRGSNTQCFLAWLWQHGFDRVVDEVRPNLV